MKSTIAITLARARIAQEEGLTFPEPFYWTTRGIDRLRSVDPNYRICLGARALDTLKAPAGKIRVAAEGDSWFDHPCIQEIIDHVKDEGYAVYRSDAPGRLLTSMLKEKIYLRFLEDPAVRAILLSGGGNDLISWKRPSKETPSPIFKRADGSEIAGDYIQLAELDAALDAISRLLGEFASDVWSKRPKLPIITHCYDWFEPRTSGPFGAWIGPQMDMVGVPSSGPLRLEISRLLVDRANDCYSRTCSTLGMIYVDLRGLTNGRWYDEIHPNDTAFGEIADRLISAIP